MSSVNSNTNIAKEIHVSCSGCLLLARRMLALHAKTKVAAQLWSQFLLEVKRSVYPAGRTLSNFAALEQSCFVQIPFVYICKLTYKNIYTQDAERLVQEQWVISSSDSVDISFTALICAHGHSMWPLLHKSIYTNWAILTTFQTTGWSTTTSPLKKPSFFLHYFISEIQKNYL